MFAREGYPFILGAAALAAIAFAMALKIRSWPLWLGALALTVVALSVAWYFRHPVRVGERGTNVGIAPSGYPVMQPRTMMLSSIGQGVIINLHVT